MNKEINIKAHGPVREDPTFKDPVKIAEARQHLLDIDVENKLFMAPNQPFVGSYQMLEMHLWEPIDELDGQSAYEYFDKIIIGHGQGPKSIDERSFKDVEDAGEEYQGTIGAIKKKVSKSGDKVLVVVCGTDKPDKLRVDTAIKEYLDNN